ncbi:hypothetical protein [Oceanobacter mangrovi]|uniref:hypothetical protein n=1 Tax=Oceanobacter mangrovi TaxID=2862510 RepID=UPI001C8DD151|nr:hypothetical protein [Oceanobacter mangrovi]
MGLIDAWNKRKAVRVFEKKLGDQLGVEWGVKNRYQRQQVKQTIARHYPEHAIYTSSAVYFWCSKQQYKLYCTEHGIPLDAREVPRSSPRDNTLYGDDGDSSFDGGGDSSDCDFSSDCGGGGGE